MKAKHFVSLALCAAALCGTGSALAAGETGDFYMFSELMGMKMMDKNKDGMVSKKEYMDMMSKAWDMNAKKMGVKGDKMTADQFKDLMTYMQGK
jgi:hypothetical protein